VTCYCCNGEAKKFGRFKNRNRTVQRYRCTQCNKTFSEQQPLDRLRTDHETVVQIVKLLCEGMGIRACARFTGCHIHTVLAILETVGQKCEMLHDRLVRNIQTDSLQIDELWARVGVRQKYAQDDEARGDQYTYLALTAREKLIVSYHTGKRDVVNTEDFVADFASRIVGRIQITSDSWRPYPFLVRKYLLDRLDYATLNKHYAVENIQATDPNRRYSPPQCVGITIRTRAGAPRPDRISTSFVERTNLSVRHFNKRFARLGLGFSRKLANHRNAISLFVCAYNFCKVHGTLGTTPAHGARITDKPWTIEGLIENATN